MSEEPTYAVMAWPDGGFAEMVCESAATREEAEAIKAQKQARYPRWRFRVAEMAA